MTTRSELEGTLARWFAIDEDSHIGVFTGPWAAWPAAVFEDYSAVDAADEFLTGVAPTTEALLSSRWLSSGADPAFPTQEATRGLFSFDADPGYGGQTIYFLDASPLRPLSEREAPSIIQRAARLVRLPSIRFSAVTQIDLADLVPLVIGRG